MRGAKKKVEEPVAEKDSKRAAILTLVADINKHYKREVITPAALFPAQKRLHIEVPVTDYCMGGGFPIGKAVEFYGPESSGKTFNAMKAIAAFQKYDWGNNIPNGIKVTAYKENKVKTKDAKSGTEVNAIVYTPEKIEGERGCKMKYVAIIDVEGTYDHSWGQYLGIDNKLLIRHIPKTGEEAIDVADALLRNSEISLVVFDSVAVTRASAEIEKSMDDQTMGLQARFWNRAAAKFTSAQNENEGEVSLILINRAYQKVGLVFGDPEQIGSGSGLRHAKAVSIKFQTMKVETGMLDELETVLGRNVKVENKKNKTSRPYKSGMYYFCMCDDESTGLKYGDTDDANDLTELGVQLGIVEKKGNIYSFGRLKVNGRDNFIEELRAKRGFLKTLTEKIVNHV